MTRLAQEAADPVRASARPNGNGDSHRPNAVDEARAATERERRTREALEQHISNLADHRLQIRAFLEDAQAEAHQHAVRLAEAHESLGRSQQALASAKAALSDAQERAQRSLADLERERQSLRALEEYSNRVLADRRELDAELAKRGIDRTAAEDAPPGESGTSDPRVLMHRAYDRVQSARARFEREPDDNDALRSYDASLARYTRLVRTALDENYAAERRRRASASETHAEVTARSAEVAGAEEALAVEQAEVDRLRSHLEHAHDRLDDVAVALGGDDPATRPRRRSGSREAGEEVEPQERRPASIEHRRNEQAATGLRQKASVMTDSELAEAYSVAQASFADSIIRGMLEDAADWKAFADATVAEALTRSTFTSSQPGSGQGGGRKKRRSDRRFDPLRAACERAMAGQRTGTGQQLNP